MSLIYQSPILLVVLHYYHCDLVSVRHRSHPMFGRKSRSAKCQRARSCILCYVRRRPVLIRIKQFSGCVSPNNWRIEELWNSDESIQNPKPRFFVVFVPMKRICTMKNLMGVEIEIEPAGSSNIFVR